MSGPVFAIAEAGQASAAERLLALADVAASQLLHRLLRFSPVASL